jgi:uncharacterized membrane protein YhaH (DUF805 family)
MTYGLWLFFSFNGRIGRGLFWLATLANLLASLLVDLALEEQWTTAPSFTPATAFYIVLSAILSVSAIAIAAKRCHDRGRTAWLAVIADGLLFAAGVFLDKRDAALISAIENHDVNPLSADLASLIAAAAIIITVLLWLIIDLGVLRGSAGPNRYGPDPRTPAAA